MSLDKAGFLAAIARKTEPLTLPSGEIIISELTATEYMEAYSSPLVKDDKGGVDGLKLTALLITRCVVGDDGARLLTDEDIEAVKDGSSATFGQIGEVVKRLNGLGTPSGNSVPSLSDSSVSV